MSAQSWTGNAVSAAGNEAQARLTEIRYKIKGLIGTATAKLGNLWSGGFAGISKEEVEGTLIPAIKSYCDTIEGTIAGVNAEGDLSGAIGGTLLQGAASDFVAACKDLLVAYVSTMRAEIDAANGAYQQWEAGSQNIASNVSSNASDIRSAASNIKLD